MIKYSILVPVYNAEAFIKKCLDSIKNQTYRDFEVVCLDDGSTDSSGDILDNYAKQDNRFKVFHVDNGGIANGRNRLLQLANGEYVYYMDSDDWLELDFFEKADVAINCHKSDIYLFDVFRDNGNTCKYMKACQYEKTTHFSDLKNTEVFENYFMRPYRTVWNKIVSRKMLIDNKFEFVDLFCADDVLYSLKIYLYAKSITYVALAGYHYYYNSYSISQKYQGDKVIKMMKSLYYEEMKLIESFSYLDIISYLNTSLIN
jgi:glycosyltransferase involved in cell wall biosynthesis